MPALRPPAWAHSQGRGRHAQPPSWGCRCPAAPGAVMRWVSSVAESSLALDGDPPPGLAVVRGVRSKLVLLVSGQVFLSGRRAFWPVWLCLQESCAKLKEIESCAHVLVWGLHGVLMTFSLHFASGEDVAWNDRPHLRKSKAKPNGKKPAAEEKKMYLEPEYTKSRITDVGFKELVVLPREIDLNEWLASNTTTFFHHVNLQYSTISEFCTGEACQTMAVCNTQYYWYDERGKKVKCTAPQYVDFVMSSVQKLVTDEDVFPTKYGREFPSSFESLVKKICKYLFHVLAHIYWSHFKETLALELHGHLNTLYVHFILFAREFNLLDSKDTAVMDDLTEVLCSGGGRGGGGGEGASGGGAGAQNHGKER
ncbi:MOB kinase activator 2 isoform X1 [Mirounga angustirostris]|uniref:MOB kinase activator 2 isoform X1 n=1 Tax=Mirounga angustirostris TaxID=9716 RepID=UPI0023E36DDA|nr:MOB kinase activator 2 isoform X1 [Mirounga angustirostris]